MSGSPFDSELLRRVSATMSAPDSSERLPELLADLEAREDCAEPQIAFLCGLVLGAMERRDEALRRLSLIPPSAGAIYCEAQRVFTVFQSMNNGER